MIWGKAFLIGLLYIYVSLGELRTYSKWPLLWRGDRERRPSELRFGFIPRRLQDLAAFPACNFQERGLEKALFHGLFQSRSQDRQRQVPAAQLTPKKIKPPRPLGQYQNRVERKLRQCSVVPSEFLQHFSRVSVLRSYSTRNVRSSGVRTPKTASGITGCAQPRFASCQ